MKIELWPEELIEKEDQVTASCTIEGGLGEQKKLWFTLPLEYKKAIRPTADAYLPIGAFLAMQAGSELVVHGCSSPSLLKNLAEFQCAWSAWRPDRYHQVEIRTDHELELNPQEESAITAFSGGVDSCFSLWRHVSGPAGQGTLPVHTALMIHGFDIPPNQKEIFQRSLERRRAQVESLGVALISLSTNAKKLGLDFNDCHGAILASAMMLLAGSFSIGIIPSSYKYSTLYLPWGSNPITDPLLSSNSFQIVHDGACFDRLEKIKAMQNWPEFLEYLQVCLRGENRAVNCCRCEKCIRTILEFRAVGLGLPPAFHHDVSKRQIIALNLPYQGREYHYQDILKECRERNLTGPWTQAVWLSLMKNKVKRVLKRLIHRY